ncbi:MAG: hypothetical protein E7290_13045 [Lachnospiraceae bacterium]|nr:hypothetical protein [Lachnospiraceae bacterium]
MEVKSARVMLQMNRAATAVDNSGSDSTGKQEYAKKVVGAVEEVQDNEEETVKLSISAAGMRKSKSQDGVQANEGMLVTSEEIEEMRRKIEGLSSQVINGNFSMTDRNSFQMQIQMLTREINQYSGEGISFSRYDNVQLSQKISNLTKTINDAAVYHRSASVMFKVKSQQLSGYTRTKLDIAI